MIFKKQLSILLTFFLLVSNLGLAFNVHYCSDDIASITINSTPSSLQDEVECCCIVKENSQCCIDKVIKSEIKTDQINVKSVNINADFVPISQDWQPSIFASNFNFKQRDAISYYCNANAPPLYLLYSQITFYC